MHRKTDSEIEQWVLRELIVSKKIHSPEICVLARDGVVSLRGSTLSFEDRLAVEEATHRATGVVAVMNELRVKPKRHLLRNEVHRTSEGNPLSQIMSCQKNKDGRVMLTTTEHLAQPLGHKAKRINCASANLDRALAEGAATVSHGAHK